MSVCQGSAALFLLFYVKYSVKRFITAAASLKRNIHKDGLYSSPDGGSDVQWSVSLWATFKITWQQNRQKNMGIKQLTSHTRVHFL